MRKFTVAAIAAAALAASGSAAFAKGHKGKHHHHHGYYVVGSWGPGAGYTSFMPIECPKGHHHGH